MVMHNILIIYIVDTANISANIYVNLPQLDYLRVASRQFAKFVVCPP